MIDTPRKVHPHSELTHEKSPRYMMNFGRFWQSKSITITFMINEILHPGICGWHCPPSYLRSSTSSAKVD